MVTNGRSRRSTRSAVTERRAASAAAASTSGGIGPGTSKRSRMAAKPARNSSVAGTRTLGNGTGGT